MIKRETVPRRKTLIDKRPRCLALLVGHAPVAGGRGGPHGGGRPAESLLGVGRERSEAHPGDGDGDRQLDWLAGEPGPDHGSGVTSLPVSLERVPGERRADESQVVEGRQLTFGAPASDLISGYVGHLVDLTDNRRREGVADLG